MRRFHARNRSFLVIALFSAMTLSSAFHFLHHLADPECGAEGRHGTAACAVCAGLHASAVTPCASSQPAAPHGVVEPVGVFTSAGAPTAPILSSAPRAPPAA
jgi:hypothetical protein